MSFREEVLVDQLVTYTVELQGTVFVIENVPARVTEETGERFFAPETVERLQALLWEQGEPSRVIQASRRRSSTSKALNGRSSAQAKLLGQSHPRLRV